MYTQYGITSFGRFCGDKDTPGIYTKVANYIPWIEEIVFSNNWRCIIEFNKIKVLMFILYIVLQSCYKFDNFLLPL